MNGSTATEEEVDLNPLKYFPVGTGLGVLGSGLCYPVLRLRSSLQDTSDRSGTLQVST